MKTNRFEHAYPFMKKQLFIFPIVALLSSGCNSGPGNDPSMINPNQPTTQQQNANPTPSPQAQDNIKMGLVPIDKKAAADLQSGVDDGHQPWRADPEMVLMGLVDYGFTIDMKGDGQNDLDSLKQVSPPQNGVVQYQISHTGNDGYSQIYLITLTQPIKTGSLGVWVISDVEINLLPVPVKSLNVNLFGGNSTETVTAYMLPTKQLMAADNYRIEVASVGKNGNRDVVFKEDGIDFSGDPDLQLIKSTSGKVGVVVIEYPSAADGGREAWHLLTAENGKIVRLDRTPFLKQPLLQNGFGGGVIPPPHDLLGYYIIPYGQVKASGNEIIETIPTDPLPNGGNNVILEFHFKFTGNSLQLLLVKKVDSL